MNPKYSLCIKLHWIVVYNVYFSYMMAVNFIEGGNRSTRKNPPTCQKSLTNFITYCSIEYTSPWRGIELTTLVVIGTDYIDSCKSNYNTIMATTAPNNLLQFEWLIVVLRIVINFLTISRTSYISMRWWWSPRCINPTLVVRMYSTSSRNYSAWSDIWLQSVILCWFRANESLYLLLHVFSG